MAITAEGFTFSMDLGVSFIAMLLMALLILGHFSIEGERAADAMGMASLERKAVFLLDAMVKNRNEGIPVFGLAGLDPERRRVTPNELDPALLEKAEQFEGRGFFVAGLAVSSNGNRKVLWETAGESCVSLDRVVLILGKLSLLEAKVCER